MSRTASRTRPCVPRHWQLSEQGLSDFLCSWCSCGPSAHQGATRSVTTPSAIPPVSAPEFSLDLFDGTMYRLSILQSDSRPVVLNLWGSWCGPCAEEAYALHAAWRRCGHAVTFVGVDMRDLDSDGRAFMTKYGLFCANGSRGADAIAASYAVHALPTTYFIAANGRILRRHEGVLTTSCLSSF
jgi:cytochrome c biogenesis protein CcmG, thiol:disulfide interchange protein DsbE